MKKIKMPKKQDAILHLRINNEMLNRLKAYAKDCDIKLAYLVREILRKWLR